MKKDVLVLGLGIVIGFLLVRGFVFVQQNYLWAVFYH